MPPAVYCWGSFILCIVFHGFFYLYMLVYNISFDWGLFVLVSFFDGFLAIVEIESIFSEWYFLCMSPRSTSDSCRAPCSWFLLFPRLFNQVLSFPFHVASWKLLVSVSFFLVLSRRALHEYGITRQDCDRASEACRFVHYSSYSGYYDDKLSSVGWGSRVSMLLLLWWKG